MGMKGNRQLGDYGLGGRWIGECEWEGTGITGDS
jgi:hypothetical protein